MQFAEPTLQPGVLATLKKTGLKLPGLRSLQRLLVDSRLESPTYIGSTVAPETYLDIGALYSLSGGRIGNVKFGRYCSIADGTIIGMHEHPIDWLTTSRATYWPQVHGWDRLMAPDRVDEIHQNKPSYTQSCPVTEIGHDVWIGQGAFIKAGIRIGDGAIVGARSTVVKDVPPYSIVVGTPANVKKFRFSEIIIEKLMTIRWWRYSIYDLHVPFDDIHTTIDLLVQMIAREDIVTYKADSVTATDLQRMAAGDLVAA